MEEEGEAQQPNSPFWANHGGGPRRTISSASASSNSSSFSSSSSSSLLKQWMFISILLVIFVLSFYSFRGRTFRLSLVRTSWDYLNFALLLFAIVCGVLGRNDNGGEDKPVESVPPPASPPRWFGYGETTVKENRTMVMRRNSSSYPDLRQQQWVSADEWRFADDIGIYRKERKSSDRNRSFREPDEGKNVRDSDFKTIHVDTVRLKKSPPPPPPPPPAPPVRTKTVGMVRQSEGKDERRKEKIQSSTPSQPQPQQPSIPPPSPPIPATMKSPDGKEKRSQRRRKDIAAAISMFYQKNKRNSSKGKRSYDDFLLTSTTPLVPIPPPPPPPPPPVRSNPSVLYQLFHSKKERSNNKRVHSVPPPPPPPLPPPARTITPVRIVRPPIPSRSEMGRSKKRETAMSNQVPVIPPPPVEEMVFPAVAEEGGDRGSSLYCPSPDVNSKADMFIARLHEGWRLEKLNSIKHKEKQKQEEEENT